MWLIFQNAHFNVWLHSPDGDLERRKKSGASRPLANGMKSNEHNRPSLLKAEAMALVDVAPLSAMIEKTRRF